MILRNGEYQGWKQCQAIRMAPHTLYRDSIFDPK